MKFRYKIAALVATWLGLVYLCLCTSFPFFPDESRSFGDVDCLIKTHWQQMGGFEACTPDSQRLGCWSTALAQIAFYHRSKPIGRVRYTSRQGYVIDEQLDERDFDFSLFRESINSITPDEAIQQMARYNYFAAVVVQKDFGTDRYMNKLAPAELFEKHYQLKVDRYVAWHNWVPNTLGKLEKVIYDELNERRPVLLHFANLRDFGHSAVVDGYRYSDDKFLVHLNQGQGGSDDGWYDFHQGILKPDDNALRVVYTFRSF